MSIIQRLVASLLCIVPLIASLPTQDCPILGLTFSSDFDLVKSEAFQNAVASFPAQIQALFDSGTINDTYSSFAIDVYSTSTNTSIYSFYHTGSALNSTLTSGVFNDDTIIRIGSVSKLFTSYAILAYAGIDVLDHPVTSYLPELAGNYGGNAMEKIMWENITVGALMSQQGGTGGFLPESVACFDGTTTNCTLEDFLSTMRDKKKPVVPVYKTALYSDVGFGILGSVLERLTGLSYNDAIQTILAKPLGLNSTSSLRPLGTDFNAIVMPGSLADSSWGFDNQITAPSGGIYSNNADLRTLGLSILNSNILDLASTRFWMKPHAGTSSLTTSVGAPWEIYRLALTISANSTRTRLSDLYTKLGGQAGYSAITALSPDYGPGFTILLAGANSVSDRIPLRDVVGQTFLPAAQHAAFENAQRNYAGVFVDSSVDGTNLTLSVDENEPGLGLESLYIDGTPYRSALFGPDVLGLVPEANISVRLYPTGLSTRSTSSCLNASSTTESPTITYSYRAMPELMPPSPRSAVEGGTGLFDDGCQTWLDVDFYSGLDSYGIDEFLLDVIDGKLMRISNPAGGISMTRIEG